MIYVYLVYYVITCTYTKNADSWISNPLIDLLILTMPLLKYPNMNPPRYALVDICLYI